MPGSGTALQRARGSHDRDATSSVSLRCGRSPTSATTRRSGPSSRAASLTACSSAQRPDRLPARCEGRLLPWPFALRPVEAYVPRQHERTPRWIDRAGRRSRDLRFRAQRPAPSPLRGVPKPRKSIACADRREAVNGSTSTTCQARSAQRTACIRMPMAQTQVFESGPQARRLVRRFAPPPQAALTFRMAGTSPRRSAVRLGSARPTTWSR